MLTLSLLLIFMSLAFHAADNIDHLKEAQEWVTKVYKQVYYVGCKHSSDTAKRFEQIKTKRKINCEGSASIVYQKAGIIPIGQTVSHTSGGHDVSYYDKENLQKSISLSFVRAGNLKKGTCDLVKVMKKFDNMPNWLKTKGIMYVQDSNICISYGNNKIFSCNLTGETYSRNHRNPLQSSSYPFNHPILWAVVPRSNGKSNVYSGTTYKHIPC